MYKPSPTACKLLLACSFKFIQKNIAAETGNTPSFQQIIDHYDAGKTLVGESISDDVYAVMDEVVREGGQFGLHSNTDCYVLLIDRNKVMDEPLRRRLVESMAPDPSCNINPAIERVCAELYDYLRDHQEAEGVVVNESGDIYLECFVAEPEPEDELLDLGELASCPLANG